MSWLTRVLGLDTVASQQKEQALALVLPQWQNSQTGETARGYRNAVEHGYRRNELIYACIKLASDSTASVSLKAYSANGNEQPNNPLRKLITRPNPYFTEFDFWSSIIVMQKLSGHAYFEKVRSRAGMVVELWPLRPDWMAPVKQDGGVQRFRYGAPGMDPVYIPAADVIDFNLLDPLDLLYGGVAPVEVAARVGDSDNSATDFIKGFFEQGAFPAGLLTTKGKLTDAMIADTRRRWGERYRGWRNQMEPAVLDMDVTYQKIGFSISELQFEILDARAERRICMVMGVPRGLVGADSGEKNPLIGSDVHQALRLSWWEDHLFAEYQHIKDIIEVFLAPEFGSPVVEWDFTRVPALQDDQSELRAHALDAFSKGAIMLDMYLGVIGEPALPNGVGQVFYVPSGVTVTPAKELNAPPAPQPAALQDATDPGLGDGQADGEASDDATANAGSGKGLRGPSHLLARPVAANAPDDALRRKREREMQAALETHYDAFLGRVRKGVRT